MPDQSRPATGSGGAPVAQLASSLADAWNAHDARAFAAPFAPDADFTNVVGVHVTGRAAVERLRERVFATVFRESQLSIEDNRTRPLGNDRWAADVSWSMTGPRTADDGFRPRRHGVMALILRDSGGTLQIEVMHNPELASPPPRGHRVSRRSDEARQ